MDDRYMMDNVVSAIEMVSRHGYAQIAILFDQGRYDDARKVAEVLKEVGIV